MTKTKVFGMVVAMALVTGSARLALADNVVVGGGTPAAPAPTVVQPVQAEPAPAPVVQEPSRKTVVHEDVTPNRNYAGTIAVSALMGGVAGALIGGAIYFLDNQTHPYNIAYWAAGGVLVGTGVGVAQLMVQESRASSANAMNHAPSDPAPTFRLALYKVNF
jgi:hypothetical protein